MRQDAALDAVRDYYGKVLKTNSDLQTTACCAVERLPPQLAAINEAIHPEVRSRFYGCGLVIPPDLTGLTVLDLGSGSGRDVFLLSKLVGPTGQVIGIDMTPEQLAVGRRHVDYHTQAFGFDRPNVRFIEGLIEDLEGAGIGAGTIDLVVSNCVVNLSPDKERVMREVLRVLKPGGELYFADVYADRRLPTALRQDPVLLGECLGGAAYNEDFRRLLLGLGVSDVRVVARSPIQVTNPELQAKVGNARFQSLTHRVFKLPLEDKCEDYGQVAYYLGSIPESPHAFLLDDHHYFEAGRPMTVCGNTADMLAKSRYGRHFKVVGDKACHFGLFPCGPQPPTNGDIGPRSDGACC